MQISYIILAHKNPKQLKRLVERLQEPWTRFYIHIDKNIHINEFRFELEATDDVIYLPENYRYPGIWGDIGIVKATLEAMRLVLNENRNGYCILITGQDYPLRSNHAISDFFQKNDGKNFLSIVQNPDSWDKHYLDRITKYKINKSSQRGHFLQLSSIFDSDFYDFKTLGKLNYLRKTGQAKEISNIFRKRQFPKNIEPYGGGVYFALKMDLIQKVLEYHEKNPKFLEWNNYTLCADEVFFHSVIMKIQQDEDLNLERSLTYVNWDRPSGPLPVTFEIEDLQELTKASKDFLWARKFDVDLDKRILDEIDEKLLA